MYHILSANPINLNTNKDLSFYDMFLLAHQELLGVSLAGLIPGT